jgi:hypothetical protein
MQIRYMKTGEVEHVSNEVGKFAVKTGLASEVIPTPKQEPIILASQWAASEGRHASIDYQFPPFIVWSCGACGANSYVENPSEGFVGRHCGLAEPIPSHVREKYDELMKAYKFRSRKPPALTLDSKLVDRQLASVRGIKTREQLAIEMQADIELSKRMASKK